MTGSGSKGVSIRYEHPDFADDLDNNSIKVSN